MEAADFSGYATKAGLKCSDGRTITAQAFQHMNGLKVPLVWQHGHGDPENVLGHAILECRHDGVYAHGFFNGSQKAQHVKMLVHNGDVNKMSIYANQLKEHAKQVLHGMIREVSLVIAGANPGAFIDQVRVSHSDDPNDFTELEDEAIIHMGLQLEFVHADADDEDDEEGDTVEHAGKTVQQIYDSMTPEQQEVCNFMVATALDMPGDAAEHSDTNNEGDNLEHQEGNADMGTTRNVFDQSGGQTDDKHTLSHDAVKGIFADALRMGSMKDAVEAYALKHNIDNIDLLFPDAKMIGDRPDFVKRRTEWVTKVLNATSKSPFSRIKTMTADLTFDEARAKGYVKGNMKKEEFFAVSKRTTSPTTIYKKQKLDRDDILDITSFDVVAWLKFEMRFMLEEEAARAILIGDGRDVGDEDKIKDPTGQDGIGIRSIYNDDEFYVTTVNVNILDANSDYNEIVEAVLLARRFYKGTGTPDFYSTEEMITRMLLSKDGMQRRRWNSVAELATAMRVNEVIAVEPMEEIEGLIGIVVNLTDYNVGTDKGGEINFFDDFDIDYNQYKYLMETRFSGALIKHKSALKIMSQASGAALVDPITAPTFVEATGVVTIPTQTGVTYKNSDTNATLSAGAQAALAPGATLNVLAVPASASYYFETDAEDEWSFTRPAA